MTVGGGSCSTRSRPERGAAFGLDFGEFYGLGRGGVLGDVDADVVASAFVFFNPGHRAGDLGVRDREARTRRRGCRRTRTRARRWGRDRIGSADGLEELAPLLDRVVASASPIGAPLFAGWRACRCPTTPRRGSCEQLHVLRELRGGLHGARFSRPGSRRSRRSS